MFITMVHHTTENATQYLTIKPTREPIMLGENDPKFGDSDIDLMNYLGLKSLEVKQTICGPYTIIKGGANTIHRGIPNRTNKERPLFWVNYSETDFHVKDQPSETQSTKASRDEPAKA